MSSTGKIVTIMFAMILFFGFGYLASPGIAKSVASTSPLEQRVAQLEKTSSVTASDTATLWTTMQPLLGTFDALERRVAALETVVDPKLAHKVLARELAAAAKGDGTDGGQSKMTDGDIYAVAIPIAQILSDQGQLTSYEKERLAGIAFLLEGSEGKMTAEIEALDIPKN